MTAAATSAVVPASSVVKLLPGRDLSINTMHKFFDINHLNKIFCRLSLNLKAREYDR
jgi:hypothetical protein